jgi:uncharacterized protein YoxC
MPSDVTRAEFKELQQEVEGEKLVTRHILEQTRRNSDDLAAIKTRLDRVEGKVDGVDRKVDLLGRKVDDLAKSLPRIVADVMREVQRERDAK